MAEKSVENVLGSSGRVKSASFKTKASFSSTATASPS